MGAKRTRATLLSIWLLWVVPFAFPLTTSGDIPATNVRQNIHGIYEAVYQVVRAFRGRNRAMLNAAAPHFTTLDRLIRNGRTQVIKRRNETLWSRMPALPALRNPNHQAIREGMVGVEPDRGNNMVGTGGNQGQPMERVDFILPEDVRDFLVREPDRHGQMLLGLNTKHERRVSILWWL